MLRSVFVLLLISFSCLQAGKPVHEYRKTPDAYFKNFDSLNIVTPDGARLTSWLIRSRSPERPVIIFSGSDACNMSYFLELAQYIVLHLDCSICFYDYRGYGTSSAFYADSSMLIYPEYLTDLNTVIDTVKRRIASDSSRIILYGMSMGASLSLCSAGQRNDISAILADSPFETQEAICRRLKTLEPGREIEYRESDLLNPLLAVGKIKPSVKICFIGCQNDHKTPMSALLQLYEAFGGDHKSIWIAPNCDHLQAISGDTETYFSLLKDMTQE